MLASSTQKFAIAHGRHLPPVPDAPTTFTQVLERITPDSGNVILLDTGEDVTVQTYANLRERAAKMLCGLRTNGLRPGNIVILQVDRPNFIPAFWSCILGGFLPIPMAIAPSYSKPNSSLTKLYDVLNLLSNPYILTTEILTPQIHNTLKNQGISAHISTIEQLECYSADTQWHPSHPNDLALFLLSSGTTGNPKLISRSHRDAVRRFSPPQQSSPIDASTVDLRWTPLDHINGLRLVAPNAGCKIHLSTDAFLQNPLRLLDIIQHYRVTRTVMLNFALKLIIDSLETVPHRRWDLSSLQQIILGAEPIVAKTARTFLQTLIHHGLSPQVLHPSYSMSEIGPLTRSKKFSLDATSDQDTYVSVGQPTPNHAIRIVDNQGHIVQEGQVGSIEATGPTMAAGYYQNPEANQASFPMDGWFRTGDLGFLKNGSLTVVGREKEIIIVNGANYHAHQIDKIVEEISGVTPLYTVSCGVRHSDSNTDELAIFFHTSYTDPEQISGLFSEIRQAVIDQCGINPTYLIPVEKSVIPKTGVGKLQRLALKQRFEAGEFNAIIHQYQTDIHPDYVAPRTDNEKIIADIWNEVLGIKVGINDNFFELGGNSVLVPQVIARLKQAFDVEVPLRTLFDCPTVTQLALSLNQRNQAQSLSSHSLGKTSVFQGNDDTYREPWWGHNHEYPLSPELEFYWTGSQLSSANAFSPTFSMQNQSVWNDEFAPEVFQRACNLVVERHEILRTRIVRKGPIYLRILSQLLSIVSVGKEDTPRTRQLKDKLVAVLENSHSISAKVIHWIISLKINLELALARQEILPPQSVQVSYYNCSDIKDDATAQARIQDIAHTEVQQPFDMQKGPLFRCAVIKNRNNTSTVIVTVHHGFVDLLGIQQVADELHTVYHALIRNKLDGDLSCLEIRPQYRDYATSLAASRHSPRYNSDFDFWCQHFSSCTPTTVPLSPNHNEQSSHWKNFQATESIPSEIGVKIYTDCQSLRVPTSAFFLAGYYILLSRITRKKQLYTLVNNGSRPDLDSHLTIGTFLQLFPLVIDLRTTVTITDLVQASANNIFSLLEHRKVSLPRLVSKNIRMATAMMTSPTCVFQTIETSETLEQERRMPIYLIDGPDWRFNIFIHSPGQFFVRIAYHTASYSHIYVENLIKQYQQILADMLAKPHVNPMTIVEQK